MRLHTSRQMRLWSLWLQEEWNRPSRTDNYLMQIAYLVHCGQVKEPGQLKIEDYEIKFRFRKPGQVDEDGIEEEPELTPEEIQIRANASKSAWCQHLGIPLSAIKPPPSEQVG